MHKKINTLIARALLLGLFSSFLAVSHAQAVVLGNGSDNFHYTPPPVTPKPPQVTPPSAPAPQVASAPPPPANSEYVLQRAARN